MVGVDTGQSSFLLATLCVLGLKALIDFGLFWWGRWIAKRNPESLPWRMVQWSPVVAFILGAIGFGYGSWQLSRLFDAIVAVDVEMRASLLAQGISETINQVAFFNVPALLIEVVCLIACIAGTILSRAKST